MTPRQFYARNRGYLNKDKQHTEISRIAAYLIAGVNLKKGTTIQKFWPLPWDTAPVFEEQTAEQREAFKKRVQNRKAQTDKARGNNSRT